MAAGTIILTLVVVWFEVGERWLLPAGAMTMACSAWLPDTVRRRRR